MRLICLIVLSIILTAVFAQYDEEEYNCYHDSIVGSFDDRNIQPTRHTCYSHVLDGLNPTAGLADLDFLDYNSSTQNFQPMHAINQYYLFLLIHDYQGSGYDEWVIDMARSLHRRAMFDHPIEQTPYQSLNGVQVVAIDWSRSANGGNRGPSASSRDPKLAYAQSVLNAVEVGRLLGNRLNDLITDYVINPNAPFANIYCIGHGIGAHICGIASNVFKNGRPFWKPFNRITALDPARVLFETSDDNVKFNEGRRLQSHDAFFVDVIHTTATYGFKGKVGLIDHYVNGDGEEATMISHMQPGCDSEYCSHSRSIELFQSTIEGTSYTKNCLFHGCSWESHHKTCSLGYDAPTNCGFFVGAKYCGFVSESYC